MQKKKSNSSSGIMFYNAYRNIFPIDKEQVVRFEGDFVENGEISVCMTAEEYKTTVTEREKNRINGLMRTGSQNVADIYVDTVVMEITIQANHNTVEFEIYDFQRKPPRNLISEKYLENIKPKFKENIVFLEPRNGLENDFSFMTKVILDTEYHEQLIEILKEFDPGITSILAVEKMGNTVYYVRTSGHKSAIPISVYGDGLKKALMIFAAMASNREGIVLIDEVETSIHTSAMKKVFSMLIKWARKLNIQLFVSTHSKEALDTLLTCSGDYSDGVNVYTLYRNEQKNYVRKLSCEKALDLQNKMGMELR